MHANTAEACPTLDAGENNSGVVVGNDVGVAVLWFVDLQVGVLPCELLTGIDRLQDTQVKVSAKRTNINKEAVIVMYLFMWLTTAVPC